MVPSNALQRTFRLNYRSESGTCFTLDVDARQYVVTARHLVLGATGKLPDTLNRLKAPGLSN